MGATPRREVVPGVEHSVVISGPGLQHHTCVILLGDLNCKLARKSDKLVGNWCVHPRSNQEGEHFLDLMRKTKLVAISTFFQPCRRKTNVTYIAKDTAYKPSQIDYILISSRWATSITKCRVRWGMTIQRWGRIYDHGTIECNFKTKVNKKQNKNAKRINFSILKTNDELKAKYNEEVQKNLQSVSNCPDSPSISLSILQGAVFKAASNTLPSTKPKPVHKRQISDNTRELYSKRQKRYHKMSHEERKELGKEIANSSREDYIAYIDGIIDNIESAELCGDSREVTRQVKLLSKKSTKCSPMPSRNLNGDPITSSTELLSSWNEFLTEKFKRPQIDTTHPREHNVSPEDHLHEDELDTCLKGMKDEKAPGWDNLPIEAFKHSQVAKDELFRVVNLIWDSESIPPDLVRGVFVMLYKKNSRDDFKNYRAICLLCHAYKLLSSVIARRLHHELAPSLPDSQAGFRPARGTRDNVCILKWTIKMLLKEAQPAVITFIDYTAAFDTESQLFLDKALRNANVSVKLRRVIQSIFSAASGCVRVRNPDGSVEDSEPFDISRGVLQGDIFSPVAFIAGLMETFRTHDLPDAGITVGSAPHSVTISGLEYADDAALLDSDVHQASSRLQAISHGSRKDAAMEISLPKTKAMHIHKKDRVSQTMEEEITNMGFQHSCPSCSRVFPTKRGMAVHQGRWCDGGNTIRSRKGTLADKLVQHKKRKAVEEKRPHVTLDNTEIENVHSFTYLGSCFQADGDDMADVKHRINIAQAIFNGLHHLWRDCRLPTSMKMRLYKTAVCSSLTHACEAWDMTDTVLRTLNGFNSRCLSAIFKCDIHEMAANPPFDLIITIRRRRLRFLGHILRMEPDRLVRRTILALTKGGTDYPKGSLFMDVENSTLEELVRLAQDRYSWNLIVGNL